MCLKKLSNVICDVHIKNEHFKFIGEKAKNLTRLKNLDFEIPIFFVITTKGFEQHMQTFLNEKWRNHNRRDILNVINNAPFKEIFKDELYEGLTYLSGSQNNYLAVRSSAISEDSEYSSFAGQFKTVLGVKTSDNLEVAIRECWASLFSKKVAAYLNATGKQLDCGMSIIVQKLVAAEVSGVAFSVNPISMDENEIIIESSYGLPNLIVEGAINPDMFILKKESLEIQIRNIGTKNKMSTVINGSVSTMDVPDKRRSTISINDRWVKKLASITKKIEYCFSFPQDIEWAINNNIVFILQTRPITTLNQRNKL